MNNIISDQYSQDQRNPIIRGTTIGHKQLKSALPHRVSSRTHPGIAKYYCREWRIPTRGSSSTASSLEKCTTKFRNCNRIPLTVDADCQPDKLHLLNDPQFLIQLIPIPLPIQYLPDGKPPVGPEGLPMRLLNGLGSGWVAVAFLQYGCCYAQQNVERCSGSGGGRHVDVDIVAHVHLHAAAALVVVESRLQTRLLDLFLLDLLVQQRIFVPQELQLGVQLSYFCKMLLTRVLQGCLSDQFLVLEVFHALAAGIRLVENNFDAGFQFFLDGADPDFLGVFLAPKLLLAFRLFNFVLELCVGDCPVAEAFHVLDLHLLEGFAQSGESAHLLGVRLDQRSHRQSLPLQFLGQLEHLSLIEGLLLVGSVLVLVFGYFESSDFVVNRLDLVIARENGFLQTEEFLHDGPGLGQRRVGLATLRVDFDGLGDVRELLGKLVRDLAVVEHQGVGTGGRLQHAVAAAFQAPQRVARGLSIFLPVCPLQN